MAHIMYTASRRPMLETLAQTQEGKVAVNLYWKHTPCKERFCRYNTSLLRSYHSGCERVKLLIHVRQIRYTKNCNNKTAEDVVT